jgi:hypothetical protein
MKRREFLKAVGVAGAGALGVSSLTSCGGSESPAPAPPPSPQPPSPSPGRQGVAYGAALRSPEQLAAVPTVYAKLNGNVASLPRQVDLRSSGLIPPVGNQGQQPSCVAWAVGYTTASFLAAQKASIKPTDTSRQASPADLFAKLQKVRPTGCKDGTMVTDACDILVRDKVTSLQSAPYSDSVCPAPLSVKQFGLVGYRRVATNDVMGIKSALVEERVLPIAARVHSDFESFGFGPGKTGIYRISGAATNNGHAMVVVGYDDDRQAWLVVNSWGTDFGDRGFFWFDYQSFQSSVVEVYFADVEAPQPVSPTPPNPQPSPTPSAVAFSYLRAATQTNLNYGVELLFLNFGLTEPVFVNSVAFTFEDTFRLGLPYYESASFPVGIWQRESFVQFWYALPYRWPHGTYGLKLNGMRQSGQAVALYGRTVY